MKIITRLGLFLGGIFLSNAMTISLATQEIDTDTLCNKFPYNSRCQDNSVNKSDLKTYQHTFERDRFCQEFPHNSHCQQEPVKVIKLNLDRSGRDDEWIRIEQDGDSVRLLHTNKVKQSLVSDVIDGVMDLVDLSLPILFDTNVYRWEDHQVNKVSFEKDRCQQRCMVTGKETLKLPQGTSIHQGLFTIEYQENDLVRSLSFRIPEDAETETTDTVVVNVSNRTSE